VSWVEVPLESKEGRVGNVFRTFDWKSRPKSGFDCLIRVTFARQLSGERLHTSQGNLADKKQTPPRTLQ